MNRRMNVLVLLMVGALLLCEINLAITDDPFLYRSDVLSDSGAIQEQSVSSLEDVSYVEFCIPESISGHPYDSLFNIRPQTKGRGSQRSTVRLLLLFVSILCLLKIAFRHLKCRLFLPEDASASSVILFFIHDMDGKK